MNNNSNMNTTLEDLLRRCVGCGLCLPHCATWAVSGNEVHSPRGRLLLLEDLLQSPNSTTRSAYADAFDHCIGCMACETACPSGVPFSLLEHGQSLVAAHNPRQPYYLSFLNRQLDSAAFLKLLRVTGGAVKSLLRGGWGPHWRRRLNDSPMGVGEVVRLLGSMPSSPHADDDLRRMMDHLIGASSNPVASASPESGMIRDIAFFVGCANNGLMPATTRRLAAILHSTGSTVHFLENQQCCGALAAHTGSPGKAALLARSNLQSFDALPYDQMPVLVEAAGCGLQLKDYGPDVAERIVDAAVLLNSISLPAMREIPLKVVYHDPCHALHGQGIFSEPRNLLQQIPGLELIEPQEADMCCGSGGAWGLHHQEMSQELGRRKARNLISTGADLVVTSNPGCLGQIADGLACEKPNLPILPLTDLLWYALFTETQKK